MKKNRKLSAVAAVSAVALVFTGVGASSANAAGEKITFIQGVAGDAFYITMGCGIAEAAAKAGAVVTTTNNGFRVKMDKRPIAVDVATLPYPGFPTDLQPMVIALNAIAEGTSLVTENVFEGRFMFVNELLRLGANIQVDGHHAAITGITELSAAPVAATDIRAGAGLVLAALVSDGITIIEDAYHIDRGYPDFPMQLQSLGADVTRV